VYRAADSVIISAAKRGFFEAPGIRDTRRIRITMIMVESVVVPTDKVYVVTSTALLMPTGNQAGYTWRTKYAMPVAKSPCQENFKFRAHRPTNGGDIQDEWSHCCSPATITYDPTAPDLKN
jgi:hypothetical protein